MFLYMQLYAMLSMAKRRVELAIWKELRWGTTHRTRSLSIPLVDCRWSRRLIVSPRSKRFQSSYWAKVRAKAKKRLKGEGEGEGRRGNACPQTPRFWKTPLDISRFGWLMFPMISNQHYPHRANQKLRSWANAVFQNRGVCGQAVPSFPSPSPVIHFFLLLSQLSRRTSRGNAWYAG